MSNRNGRRPPGAGSGPSGGGTDFLSGGSHVAYSIQEVVPKLTNAACMIPDADQGRARLEELMGSAFRAKFGAEMKRLDRAVAHEAATLAVLERKLRAGQSEDEHTPEWLPASRINHGRDASDHVETPWRDRQMRHKAESVVILVMLPLAVGASVVTSHDNLVATGLPVFLESEVLPWAMSGIPVLAAMGIKSFFSVFRREGPRKAFTYALNAAAGLSIASWIFLFAENFHGLGGGLNVDDLFSDPSLWDHIKETGFVMATLTTEILVSAALFHRLDKIEEHYAPNYWRRNLESEAVQDRVEALQRKTNEVSDRLSDQEGEREAYENALNLQVHTATLAYDARRGRSDDIL